MAGGAKDSEEWPGIGEREGAKQRREKGEYHYQKHVEGEKGTQQLLGETTPLAHVLVARKD